MADISKIEKRIGTFRASDDSDGRTVEGYAALFNVDSEPLGGFIERIEPGAFFWTDVRAVFNHDPNLILARTKSKTLELKQDDKGLFYRFSAPQTTTGNDLVESIRSGNIDQSSFAFQVHEQSWDFSEDPDVLDVRTIKKAEVFDVSPVTFPAYVDTTVAVRSRAAAAPTRAVHGLRKWVAEKMLDEMTAAS